MVSCALMVLTASVYRIGFQVNSGLQELEKLSVQGSVLHPLLLVLGLLLVLQAELWPPEASYEDWRGPELMSVPLPHFHLASPRVFSFLQKGLGLNSAQTKGYLDDSYQLTAHSLACDCLMEGWSPGVGHTS